MSDPFSATGGAVGVISLGITVCNSLIDYCSSWKGYDDDAIAACKYLEGLNDTFKALQDLLQKHAFSPDTKALVERRILSCLDGVKKLEKRWDEVKNNVGSSTTRSRVTAQARKALYPFKGKTLSKLQQDVSYLLENLSLALEALNLDAAGNILTVASESKKISKEVTSLSHKLGSSCEGIETIGASLQRVERDLTDLTASNASFGPQLRQIPDQTALALQSDLRSISEHLQSYIEAYIRATAKRQQDEMKALIVRTEADPD